MRGQDGLKQFRDGPPALVERTKLHAAIVRNDFERRAGGSDIPTRVPAGVLVSRGKIYPTVTIKVAQDVRQALPEIALRNGASDRDPVSGRIAVFAHRRCY